MDSSLAGDESVVVAPLSLPFIPGSTKVSNEGTTAGVSVDTSQSLPSNPVSDDGFLIPCPMNGAAKVLQFFSAAEVEEPDVKITVSGIPGSVPFPDFYGSDFTIPDNEIHIGGMTDVYIKQTAGQTLTTDPISLQPSSISDGEDIVFSGSDGKVLNGDGVFYSASLEAALQVLRRRDREGCDVAQPFLDFVVEEIFKSSFGHFSRLRTEGAISDLEDVLDLAEI